MSALTKILIVLQLVFSLVVSVLLVLFISKTEDSKKQLVTEHASYVASSAQLDKTNQQLTNTTAQLTAVNAELNRASDAVKTAQNELAASKVETAKANGMLETQISSSAQVQEKLTALTKSQEDRLTAMASEIKDLREKVPTLTKSAGELARQVQELTNQLDAANHSIRQYQIILANPNNGGTNGAGVNMKPQVGEMETHAAANTVNGTVTDVAMSAGRMHIETKLGARDGIQVGTKLFVYRGNGYVGDVTVESVTPDASVAVVTTTKPGEQVQKGDYVATVGN